MSAKEKISFDKLRGIPLEHVMSLFGGTRSHRDKNKWETDKGHVTITGYVWYCHEGEKGGAGAIDLAVYLGDYDPKRDMRAIAELLDGGVALSRSPVELKKTVKPKVPLVLPTNSKDRLNRVKWYLHTVRKLPWLVINTAIEQGRVYADEKGNVVFLYGYDIGKHVAAAELRGTVPDKPYHLLVPGSDKNQPFLVVGGDKKVLAVGEAPITAMSYLALNPGITVAATAGAGRELPKAVIEKYHVQGYTVISVNDNDSAGDAAYDWLCENLALDVVLLRDKPETADEDWNDVLKAGRRT